MTYLAIAVLVLTLFTLIVLVAYVQHRRKHLFYLRCPWCRRDPMRMAIMADRLGTDNYAEALWNTAQSTETVAPTTPAL